MTHESTSCVPGRGTIVNRTSIVKKNYQLLSTRNLEYDSELECYIYFNWLSSLKFLIFLLIPLPFVKICLIWHLKPKNDGDDSTHKVEFTGGNVHLITTKESWDQKLTEARRDGKIVSISSTNHLLIVFLLL